MRILLDVKDSKAGALMEILTVLPFVKIKKVKKKEKELNHQLIAEVKEAMHNLALVKAGKMEARDAREVINEL